MFKAQVSLAGNDTGADSTQPHSGRDVACPSADRLW